MVTQKHAGNYRLKSILLLPVRIVLAATLKLRRAWVRLYSHAHLETQLSTKLPKSVVVLGRMFVDGTGAVEFGEACYLYPDLHLETRDGAVIKIGDGVVISRGAHLVAMAGITIGRGTMIGEYTSLRDANHQRAEGISIREAGHKAKPIVIGDEVWIGRGVTVLGGVTIGDGATVGANAVVTRDVLPHTTVGGVPAKPLQRRPNEDGEAIR
jgi:acetyltransferase-like isoleucine patch superfamily enzyme